jgi:hypothetical protein
MVDHYQKVEGRNDLVRDTYTNALFYTDNKEVMMRNKINRMEKEIHTLKDDIYSIKNLLERIVDGR